MSEEKERLSKIKPGTRVRLAVYGRHNTCGYFDSEVLPISEVDRPYMSTKSFDNILLVKLFRQGENGTVVNFESDEIVCELMLKDTKTVYDNVLVRRVDLPLAGDVHAVVSHDKPPKVNRRKAFRLFVGLNGAANTQDHLSANVIIRDVSVIGVGFICSPKFAVAPGDQVTVSFVDETEDRQFFIIMPCTVVRVDPWRGNTMIVGCTINQEIAQIGKYIMLKQQERQRRFRKPLRRGLRAKEEEENNQET
jgi:hypothetical protein